MTKSQRQRQVRARRERNADGRVRNQANRMLRRFHLPALPDTPVKIINWWKHRQRTRK